jgi:type VI secretion system protein ImpH
VLLRARHSDDPSEAVRFRTPPGLVFPTADVTSVDEREALPPVVTTAVMGLTGPSGVLPRHYTELVTQTLRARSSALRDFLDLLAHRFVAFFARSGMKYRPARSAEIVAVRNSEERDPISQVLLALTGYGTAHLVPRMAAGAEPLLHYAGLFAMRPRSADRLAALVSDWLGMRVEVVEFAGAWLFLPPDQRTRMPVGTLNGAWCRLGVDAAVGIRAWDPQARIILRVGPLSRARFETLLPDRTALHRLVSLVRAYVGFEIGFAINPVLAARDVPPLKLDKAADPPPRLGWNTWIPSPSGGPPRQTDAADALFEAEIVEAQAAAKAPKEHAA